jgi:hypothetical protein
LKRRPLGQIDYGNQSCDSLIGRFLQITTQLEATDGPRWHRSSVKYLLDHAERLSFAETASLQAVAKIRA